MGVTLRERKTKKGTSYYLDIIHQGKRWKESLDLQLPKRGRSKTEMRELAKELRDRRAIDLTSFSHGVVPRSNLDRSFIGYFAKLAEEKDVRGHNWASALSHLRGYAGDEVRFRDINEDWLDGFRRYLFERLSQNSVHTYFSKAKAALRRAVKDKILVSNPAEFVDQVSRTDTPRIYLSLDEVERLHQTECDNSEIKRAFLFSCFSGLRISDIRKLTWSMVDGSQLQFRQTKTGGFEYFPLTKTARTLLGVRKAKDSLIFDLLSEKRIYVHLRRWCAAAGIDKHITFHTARHTFATLSLTMGNDLLTTSKLLGHREIKTTMIYAQIIDPKKREAVDRFPELGALEKP